MDLRERERGVVRRHPWELARATFFLDILGEYGGLSAARQVLDAGSGDGFFAESLAGRAPVLERLTCWDIHYTDSSRDELGIRDARVHLTPDAPSQRFDLIVALDLLEHVEDDRELLLRLVRDHLEPWGTILLSVPAWPALETDHDRHLLHHRRYRPEDLDALTDAAALTELAGGGLFHSLLVPRAVAATVGRLRRPRDESHHSLPSPLNWRHGRLVTAAAMAALRADNWLSRTAARRGVALPGLSEWTLCRVEH